MIKIGKKEIELFKTLANNQGSIKMDSLLDDYCFSERVLKYSIGFMNDFLKEKDFDSKIVVSNKTLFLQGGLPLKNILFFLDNIEKSDYYISKEERNEIIYFNYIANLGMTVDELALFLNVGKTTVKQSLATVRNMLRGYHVELMSFTKIGLSVVGEEENIRSAMLEFLYNYCDFSSETQDGFQRLTAISIKTYNPYLKELISTVMKKFNCDKNAVTLFQKADDDLPKIDNDEIYKIALLNLIIIFYRTEQKFFIAEKQAIKINKEGLAISKILNEYCKLHIGKDISCTEFESFMICLNKGYIEQISQTHHIKFFGSVIWIQRIIAGLISKACDSVNAAVNMDNEEIKYAIDMLYNHFYAAVERLHSEIYIKNPFLEEIKEHYEHLFNSIRKEIEDFEIDFGKKFTEDEISYFTLLVENLNSTIIRNSKRIKNVVLICGMGYGTSQILKKKLERSFEINIKETIPYYKFDMELDCDIDLYISTVAIENSYHKNIVKVSPLLTTNDIEILKKAGIVEVSTDISKILEIVENNALITNKERLTEQLHTLFKQNQKNKNRYEILLSFISEEQILLHKSVQNWEESIRLTGGLLVKTGCASESYVDDMIKNIDTLGAYITIGRGVALPHAMNNHNVFKTGFSLVTLKEPVKFANGNEVDVIIGFCNYSGNEYAEPLVTFMDLIEHHNLLHVKNNMKEPKDFIDYMKNI